MIAAGHDLHDGSLATDKGIGEGGVDIHAPQRCTIRASGRASMLLRWMRRGESMIYNGLSREVPEY